MPPNRPFADFRGLPHRIELVHERDGVRYYNDSIATIPEAAIAALESFPPKRAIQIVGGKDAGLPLTAMCNALAERAKAVLCIGATGKQIAELIGKAPMPGCRRRLRLRRPGHRHGHGAAHGQGGRRRAAQPRDAPAMISS